MRSCKSTCRGYIPKKEPRRADVRSPSPRRAAFGPRKFRRGNLEACTSSGIRAEALPSPR